jgi:hypothetical protein
MELVNFSLDVSESTKSDIRTGSFEFVEPSLSRMRKGSGSGSGGGNDLRGFPACTRLIVDLFSLFRGFLLVCDYNRAPELFRTCVQLMDNQVTTKKGNGLMHAIVRTLYIIFLTGFAQYGHLSGPYLKTIVDFVF